MSPSSDSYYYNGLTIVKEKQENQSIMCVARHLLGDWRFDSAIHVIMSDMTTAKRHAASRANIGKPHATRTSVSSRQHARAQPQARVRKKPGTGGAGNYYHVGVRDKKGFVTFRTQDVGRRGHIQRVAGKRGSGSWDTVKWLIHKDDAHIERGHLIPDTDDAKKMLAQLGSRPIHIRGDTFEVSRGQTLRSGKNRRRRKTVPIRRPSARHKRRGEHDNQQASSRYAKNIE